jgi:hypothetical protein
MPYGARPEAEVHSHLLAALFAMLAPVLRQWLTESHSISGSFAAYFRVGPLDPSSCAAAPVSFGMYSEACAAAGLDHLGTTALPPKEL